MPFIKKKYSVVLQISPSLVRKRPILYAERGEGKKLCAGVFAASLIMTLHSFVAQARMVIHPKNGSWPSRNPSTAAEAAALRANGLSPNG